MALASTWTEIVALSNSALSDIAGYARTRLRCWRIAVLWLLLVAALAAAGPGRSAARWVAGLCFLTLAVLLLRLWDDLADLLHDRVAHPERVLVQSTRPGSFRAGVWMGLPLLALFLWPDPWRLASWGALLAVLAWLYHGAPRFRPARAAREYLVLAKYPVLVMLAGAAPSLRAALVGVLLYSLLAFHAWRDQTS
jgi:hypothetical protein